MSYLVKLDQFSGPLDKLLELIEAKKLEITTISLAAVTEDFLNYLKALSAEARHPSVLADFVVVASRLLLIKSKSILPSLELTQEEEVDIRDLEARLKIYKEFKNAALNLNQAWDKNPSAFARQFLMNLPVVFYPPKDLQASDLEKAILSALNQLQSLIPEKQTVRRIVISVEEKVKELLRRLQEQAQQSFSQISKDRPKLEIIVLFLAMLHLLRDHLITVEQSGQFSEITIKK
ncbi:MAG: segregation/condensation protein A [bacterium]|nr:segregation/condensation protein A [bacterium]